jgi:hypothetical protein
VTSLAEGYAYVERDRSLGAANLAPFLFFMEFGVCFYRSRSVFEVQPRQATASTH